MLDRQFVAMLNVLALLREKPMTFKELHDSGYFKSSNQLVFALRRLKQAGLIEKIKAAKIYVILGHGITFLSLFPWKPIPAEVFDIVVPLGEKRNEGNSESKCRSRNYLHCHEESYA